MNELIQRLASMNKGAHAHTINKAIFYLQKTQKQGTVTLLEMKTRAALQTGDWSEVKAVMANWW